MFQEQNLWRKYVWRKKIDLVPGGKNKKCSWNKKKYSWESKKNYKESGKNMGEKNKMR